MSNSFPLDRCIVEVDGEPVGIVVLDGAGYTFIAASRHAFEMDRTSYASVAHAVREVEAHFSSRQPGRVPE